MSIALNKNSDGYFTISFKDGVFVTEEPEMSYIKHNLMVFGRLETRLNENRKARNGNAIDALLGQEHFSKAWIYFKEGLITQDNIKDLVREFNRACNRDLNLGLFKKQITLNSVVKTSRGTLLFKISVGGDPVDLTINI